MRGACRWRHLTGLLVVATATLAVYVRVLDDPLLEWDDHLTLATNPAFNPPSWAGVARYWAEPHLALYVPLTYTVWGALSFAAWDGVQLRAWPFRVASVGLHLLATLVVIAVTRQICRAREHPRAGEASLVAGLVFALHPAQVESVAWASGLKDVLSGLLGWASVSAGLHALLAGRRAGGWWLASAMLLGLALLAKPSAVAFPLAFGLLAWAARPAATAGGADGEDDSRRYVRRFVLASVVGLVMAAPVALVARAVQPPGHGEIAPAMWRPLLALDALGFYIRHVAVPWPLAVDYGRSPGVQRDDPLLLLWAGVPLAVAAAVMLAGGERRRFLAAGLGAAAALLLPVLGLVPFQYQRYSSVADHYLYAALGGVALAVAGLTRTPRSLGLAASAAAIYGLVAAAYVPVWSSTITLFEHTARVVPHSFAAQRVLGYQAAARGDGAAAEMHYRLALRLRPDDVETWYNLGNLLLRRGDLAAARSAYEAALNLRPDLAPALQNLAFVLEQTGEVAGAVQIYRRLLEIDPESRAAREGLGRLGASPSGP